MKTPVKYHYFLEEFLAELNKNILTISDDYVDHLFQQIYIDTRVETIDISNVEELIITTDKLEIAMLKELLMYVQEKKEYYYHKKHEYYDFSALKPVALFLIILLILIGLIYGLYQCYHVPKKREMLTLIEELKFYDITITEHSRHVYRDTEYWLELSGPEYISIDEYDIVKSMIDRVYKIHSTLHGKFRWISILIVSVAFYIITIIWSYIKKWYKPQYKERYERFSWLEAKIQQRIDCIQENSII